jgi:hypothetical protein
MLLRIAAFISAFVLVAFVVVLMNRTLQLVQVASEASPILGKLVFYGLLALYTTLLLVPLILYLRLPKQLTPPTSIESSGFPRYLARLIREEGPKEEFLEFLGRARAYATRGRLRLEMGTDSGVVSKVRDQILTCGETLRGGARRAHFQVAFGGLAAGSSQT